MYLKICSPAKLLVSLVAGRPLRLLVCREKPLGIFAMKHSDASRDVAGKCAKRKWQCFSSFPPVLRDLRGTKELGRVYLICAFYKLSPAVAKLDMLLYLDTGMKLCSSCMSGCQKET